MIITAQLCDNFGKKSSRYPKRDIGFRLVFFVLFRKDAATAGSEVKRSIQVTEDGKKYVKADRQVVFGNDPAEWSEQVENYINSKIRNGEDVQLVADDGDVLTLTSATAGKTASPYRSGRTLDEA